MLSRSHIIYKQRVVKRIFVVLSIWDEVIKIPYSQVFYVKNAPTTKVGTVNVYLIGDVRYVKIVTTSDLRILLDNFRMWVLNYRIPFYFYPMRNFALLYKFRYPKEYMSYISISLY